MGAVGLSLGLERLRFPRPLAQTALPSARDHLWQQVSPLTPYVWPQPSPQGLCHRERRAVTGPTLVCGRRCGSSREPGWEGAPPAEEWEAATPLAVGGWPPPCQPVSHAAGWYGPWLLTAALGMSATTASHITPVSSAALVISICFVKGSQVNPYDEPD